MQHCLFKYLHIYSILRICDQKITFVRTVPYGDKLAPKTNKQTNKLKHILLDASVWHIFKLSNFFFVRKRWNFVEKNDHITPIKLETKKKKSQSDRHQVDLLWARAVNVCVFSYQRVLVVHESSLVQREPTFLEAFCLLAKTKPKTKQSLLPVLQSRAARYLPKLEWRLSDGRGKSESELIGGSGFRKGSMLKEALLAFVSRIGVVCSGTRLISYGNC